MTPSTFLSGMEWARKFGACSVTSGKGCQPIPSGCGVTQGNIVSPTVFNIIVDAVVCCWRTTASAEMVHNLFFADNGWLASLNAEKIQESLVLD
jgi:hypothetical protein